MPEIPFFNLIKCDLKDFNRHLLQRWNVRCSYWNTLKDFNNNWSYWMPAREWSEYLMFDHLSRWENRCLGRQWLSCSEWLWKSRNLSKRKHLLRQLLSLFPPTVSVFRFTLHLLYYVCSLFLRLPALFFSFSLCGRESPRVLQSWKPPGFNLQLCFSWLHLQYVRIKALEMVLEHWN